MLTSCIAHLNTLSIVLASQSPRRLEILNTNLGFSNLLAMPSKFAEDIDKASCVGPEEYVSKTSFGKLNDVLTRKVSLNIDPDIIISADTIVVLGDLILEKPSNEEEACKMLSSLSGETHNVLTSVSIALKSPITGQYEFNSFVESTEVSFLEIPPEFIASYVKTGEPFDKAGGYGIQSLGGSFVKKVNGCYFNVVGFPVNRFSIELLKMLKLYYDQRLMEKERKLNNK